MGQIAVEMGFQHVSLSHEVMPMVKIVPRGYTACTDAYLTPHIKRYIKVRFFPYKQNKWMKNKSFFFFKGFASGFKNNLTDTNVLFMQSDGGLTPMHL